ncbi:MAG: 3-oxoacyl-[acyl-carrier-protein] reductase [Lentisphaerae bacterium]|nr:3-oxoacyl-[acyl-carrier-protein] reductase [Lentisphaerota bacterium]
MLDNKTALVTGAARGIGRAVAETLAREGADLVLCDLNKEWLADTDKAVSQLGRRTLCLAADVSQAPSVQETVDQAIGAFGRLDILVNNAGITKDNFLIRMSEADWDAVLSVNLKGVYLFTKATVKYMMKERAGNIVNVASIVGLIGNIGQCNYSASKAGVIGFTKSAAKEFASRNIRVNAVAPGFIETKMTEKLPEEIRRKMLNAIPMGRFGSPQNVSNVVLFLASDLSAYMTGQVLTVCGGMVM